MFCKNCGKMLEEYGKCSFCDENNKKSLKENKGDRSNIGNVILTIVFGIVVFYLIGCIGFIWLGINYNANKYNETIKIPYANQTIKPGKNNIISTDMISYMEIPSAFEIYLIGSYYDNFGDIVGKCANFTTIIPKGSLFRLGMVIDCEEAKYNSYNEWYNDHYTDE